MFFMFSTFKLVIRFSIICRKCMVNAVLERELPVTDCVPMCNTDTFYFFSIRFYDGKYFSDIRRELNHTFS